MLREGPIPAPSPDDRYHRRKAPFAVTPVNREVGWIPVLRGDARRRRACAVSGRLSRGGAICRERTSS